MLWRSQRGSRLTKSIMFFKIDLKILVIAFFFTGCKSIETSTFTAKGCCPTCETAIINAISNEGVNTATWDQFQQVLTVQYFSELTTSNELQKKISLAGYDTDLYLAPDSIYLAMPKCCRYRE